MIKSEMIDVIAQKAGITKKAAGAALAAVSDTITSELKKGRPVVLTGFGTIRTLPCAGGGTGGSMSVPAKKRFAQVYPLPILAMTRWRRSSAPPAGWWPA